MKPSDQFYHQQEPLVKECLLTLRDIILSQDVQVTAEWKYGMPFFCYRGKMFCYLWYHKKYRQPYIGIVEGCRFNEPLLVQEKRSRMKIMLLDPHEDLPLAAINRILQQALDVYRTGLVKIK